jgi:pyruvate ferredoxin oxidoreductase gamma subunit
MIGAVIKATGAISIESVNEPVKERFGRLADRNIKALRRAFEAVKFFD